MGHKAATLEYPSRSERYYREPQLPPDWIRTRPEPKVNYYNYNLTRESEFRVRQLADSEAEDDERTINH